nr:NAD(P)/FAD-dependent oxidoreductase [uncultured Lichenicoccus sp.]
MGGHGRARGARDHPAAEAARAGDRHVRAAERAGLSGGGESFTGEQHHSGKHPGGDAWSGRKAVVIGSNNSAHDICADLWENGADVTMVQRTSTMIARSDSLMELALGGLYSEQAVAGGMTTEKADLVFASLPYRILHEFQIPVYKAMRERDAEFYARLERAGFMLDCGDDDSGLFPKYLRRGSGYYINIGASGLVANGSVHLKSRVGVEAIRERSVLLTDGTELPADLIVYATGYGSMNGWAARLISQEVADRVGRCWGFGSDTTKDPGPWERELRNMWKADAAGGALVPWRQPAPVAALLAVPRAATQGAGVEYPDAGPWARRGASCVVGTSRPQGETWRWKRPRPSSKSQSFHSRPRCCG